MDLRHRLCGALCLVVLVAAAPADLAGAEPDGAEPDDTEIESRLRFIEERLEAHRVHGLLWQRGWPVLFAGAAFFSTASGLHEEAAVARADRFVSAAESLLGLADVLVLSRIDAHRGTDELHGLPDATREDRLRKLAFAEALLRRNAEQADTRYDWFRHALSASVSVAGGLFLGFYYDDWPTAALHTAIGVAVGEASIWTQPWQPSADRDEYERRFPAAGASAAGPAAAPPTWTLAPLPGGALLQVGW